MSDQLAGVARFEILAFLAATAAIVFYKGLTGGPGLASLLSGTSGGPIHSERLILLLVTLFGAAQYLSQIAQSTGKSLPDVPAALLAAVAASSGVYLGGKQFRQPSAGDGAPPS